MTDAIVEVRGIGKTYDTGVEALRGATLGCPAVGSPACSARAAAGRPRC